MFYYVYCEWMSFNQAVIFSALTIIRYSNHKIMNYPRVWKIFADPFIYDTHKSAYLEMWRMACEMTLWLLVMDAKTICCINADGCVSSMIVG